MPLTVGGGIRTLDDIRAAAAAPAATRFRSTRPPCRDPEFVRAGGPALRQPVHRGEHRPQAGPEATAARSGKSTSTAAAIRTGLEAVAWAREVERLGAGEIVLTSMDADGTKDGYDLEITAAVTDAVIDSRRGQRRGRASRSTWPTRFLLGKADAALAASIFHFGEYTIQRNETKSWRARGIPVRLQRKSQSDRAPRAQSRRILVSQRPVRSQTAVDHVNGSTAECRQRQPTTTVSSTPAPGAGDRQALPRLREARRRATCT